VLSRQIIEAHDGQLSLVNREDGPGCVVTIEIPMEQDRDSQQKSGTVDAI
jgi:signal transduction histidine kinase